ncbi:hypothetical protein [Bacillus sp. AFS040349]|uniref:hypothetical protein n=1 Tax=Bacillus sp. AFS040349 TaxID=2033502 RepID=UPI00159BB5CD|nr:hypothetical protein [Bacillus sp. AFS040349]
MSSLYITKRRGSTSAFSYVRPAWVQSIGCKSRAMKAVVVEACYITFDIKTSLAINIKGFSSTNFEEFTLSDKNFGYNGDTASR